ncbi:cytochrome P450 [Amycolatopsis sp. NBC_00345]|uniref:cytochrome P450 n=1 Tax=Amycolatopsis sp. NBC_00345 TaxID=2975955 RepID=UPI002E270A66
MTRPDNSSLLPTGRRSGPFEPAPELDALREREDLPRFSGEHPMFGPFEVRAVTRYADVRAAFGHEHAETGPGGDPDPDAPRTLFNQPGFLLSYNGPEHARLRRMLTSAFTVRRLQQLRPWIEQIVDDRLTEIAQAGPTVDLVPEFALPIPSLVICELLGVPYADRAQFQHQSAVLLDLTKTAQEQFDNYAAMHAYMADLIATLRAEPGDSLLGSVIREQGDELTDEELVGFGNILLVAGHETTSNMIGLGTLALLQNPDQLAAVRDDDTVTTSAVEELLRYLSIVTQLNRRAAEDLDLNGRPVKAGERLLLSVLAANQDRELIGDETSLNVRRKPVAHLAFGFGPHQCLGQQLARIELRVALPALLRRFPSLRLAVPLEDVGFRVLSPVYGLKSLPLTW